LGESLGGAEGLLEAVSFKKAMKGMVEEESRMPDGSEFKTAGDATLKPREAKVVQTPATHDRIRRRFRIDS